MLDLGGARRAPGLRPGLDGEARGDPHRSPCSRAEGIRLVNRLRSDAKTATIPIIFALGEALDLARFRADAARVLADCRFSPQDLSSDMARVLADWQNDQDGLRATG